MKKKSKCPKKKSKYKDFAKCRNFGLWKFFRVNGERKEKLVVDVPLVGCHVVKHGKKKLKSFQTFFEKKIEVQVKESKKICQVLNFDTL